MTTEQKILNLISRQDFVDWYQTGNFDKFITGDLECEKQIKFESAQKIVLKDLTKMLLAAGVIP